MPSRQLSSTLMPIAHLSRCDDMPIIMLIIPAGATHRPYRGGGGVTPSLGLLAAQYAAQARGEAGVIKHRAVFQIVRLPSKTPRECGHSGTAAPVPQAAVSNRSKATSLCDDLIGARKQRGRHVEAECLSGLEVNH